MNKEEIKQAKIRITMRDTFVAHCMLPHKDFDSAYAQPDSYNAYDMHRNIPLMFQMGADLVAVSCYRKGFVDVLITQALYRGLADASYESLDEAMGGFKLLCDTHFKYRYTKRFVPKEILDTMHAQRIGVFVEPRNASAMCFACVRENDLDDFLRARLWRYIVPPFPRDPSEIANPHMRDLVKRYASRYMRIAREDIKHNVF